MKHWSEFLDQKTHAIKRMGKLANSLTFEVQSKELELQNAKLNLERFENQICNKIAENYSSECEFESAIQGAKNRANLWNNEPTNTHKPHTVKNY
ncbi:hypothetical protein [Flavobacterium chilense]|uniref:Uncharacterized protein n=1 Tax=Flavobacterium chilense TaxID=946677 RepID=A0A1M7DPU7_9FLAO|nr:hypothetical protein [Flavobacterium chilense]SHL81502.1 hypothetical protein SAMN05444484_102670 [Flavobacterium chilense]